MKKVAVPVANKDTIEYAVLLDEECWHLAKMKSEEQSLSVPSLFLVMLRNYDFPSQREYRAKARK